MKNGLKIALIILGVLVGIVILDTLQARIFKNSPIISWKEKLEGDSYVDKGILMDTYYCVKEKDIVTVSWHLKGTKYSCPAVEIVNLEVKEIVDTTKDIKDFSCDTALEDFYEDENYIYSWDCIKNEYMVVRYESGYEETISNALKYGTITISDLDKSNISYIKSEKENNDEHSFFGRVIESHQSYIIVEPNEDEEEKNTADKFRIELGNDNDAIYEVGTKVKITYVGGINTSNPAQIGTTKIELKSVDNFELIFNQEPGNVKRQIIDKNDNTKYDYNVYIYNGNVEIVINNKTYSLEEALKEERITMNEIIAKANHDIQNAVSYDDGGSIEYHYENYTIIKVHKINGNRDVYIGGKKLTLNDLNIQ